MRAICVGVVTAVMAMAQAPQQKSAPPSAAIKCKNVEGQGCTSRQVKALSDAVFEGKSKHDVLLPVKEIVLAASDGTLRCAQSDGSVCTTAELDIIKEIAATQQLTIKYSAR